MPKEYPVLDNSPINKWKVAKLREELKKRNLPVKGLKEALVNRLDEAIQKEMEAREMEEKEGSESASKPMSSDGVQIVDDAQKHITSEFCEAEDTVAKDDTTQKHITGESCEAEDTVANDDTSDCPKGIDSAKCIDVAPTGSAVHFAMDGERKDFDAPSEIIPSVDANNGMSDSDRIASTERAPKDTVGEDEVVKSQHDVEVKIISADETSDFKVLENCNVVPDASGEITLGNKSDPEEGFKKLTKMDAEPDLSHPSTTQVHEVIPSLGSEVKSDSIHTDTLPICVTNQLNDDLNPDNVKLEQEIVRSEMVLPSSSKDLPGVGVDHPMDDKMPSKSDGLVGGTDDDKSSYVNYSMTNENADQSLVVDVPIIEHNKSSNSNELLEGLPKDGNVNGADFSCKEKESPEEKVDVGVSAKETDFKGVSITECNMDEKDPNSNEVLEGLPKDGNLNKDTFSFNEKDLSEEGKFDAGAYANEARSQDVSALERDMDHNTSNSTERLGGLSEDANSNEDKFPCKDKESLEEETNIDSSTKEASFHDVSMIEHTTDDMSINSTELMDGMQKDENLFVDKVPCEDQDSSAEEKADIDSSNMDTNFQGKEDSSEEEKIDVDVSAQETNFQAEGESTDSGFGKATDVAGENLEKINLDQSSADDSMDEDIADSKNVDSEASEHISFEVLGKNKEEPLTKEPRVELEGGSKATELSDIHSAACEVYLEDGDKNLNLPDKRKFQDAVAPENKEPAKRQRKWNYESLKTSEPKTSSVLLLTPKQISVPNFTVPESSRTPTDSLRIDNFVRPFTLKAVQELLGKTGKVCSFWMDHIKTHCYVTFSSVEEAIETRKAVYNLQWPTNGGRCLLADFVTPQDVKSKIEAAGPSKPAAPPATGASAGPTPAPRAVNTSSQPPAGQQKGVAPWEQGERPHPLSRQLPAYDRRPATVKEQVPAVADKAEPPLPTLDELFRKTKATPRIYYLPLTDEQVSAKLNKQLKK
ncbi:unnamed protein product [Cuscuta campestris]|uniref:SAP domain-containing protein n=1 Tax=Cuscuta campestris TaxID=132261 RepID=A0A484MD58_9ASTE|nr:unnamed protein product [Cuscuta campestris]